MSFKHEKYFIDAINSGSIQEIKIAICLYIDKDAADSNGEIRNAVQYLDSKGINIWDEHKKIEDIKPKHQWDVDYIGLLQSDLMYNFSRERLDHILEVGEYVYGRNQNISTNTNNNQGLSKIDITESSKNTTMNSKYNGNQTLNDKHNSISNNVEETYLNGSTKMVDKHKHFKENNNQNRPNPRPIPEQSNGGFFAQLQGIFGNKGKNKK